MPHVPGLRSPYEKVGRLVYLGRMLDKIRLHAMGNLPPEYHANLGDAQSKFNGGRCCRFVGIEYYALERLTLGGGTDKDILAWAHAHGIQRNGEECVVWNRFMSKGGWQDDRSARLKQLVMNTDWPENLSRQASTFSITTKDATLLSKSRGYAFERLLERYRSA